MTQHEEHPASQIFPMMSDSELAELAADIRKNGLIEPILLFGNQIIDGRNRLAACGLAGIEPRYEDVKDVESPTQFVVSKNIHRRHLTTSQRAAIAAEMVPMLAAEAKERQRASGGDRKSESAKSVVLNSAQPIPSNPTNNLHGKVRDIAGKAVGVSSDSVQKALTLKRKNPEEFERVRRGDVSVNAAHRKIEAREEPSKRQQIIENAAKRKMVDILSQVRGLCRGLSELKISMARAGCSEKDIDTWVGIARQSAKQLRMFAAKLKEEEENGTA